MILYKFYCKNCGHLQEQFLNDFTQLPKRDEAINKDPERDPCERCNRNAWRSTLTPPTLDSTSQTHRQSINGHYSTALGGYVSNRKEEEKIMAKKGFVCEADLPRHFWEDKSQAINEKNNEQDKAISRYTEVIDRGGSKEEAVEALAPTQEILNGKTDKVWDSDYS